MGLAARQAWSDVAVVGCARRPETLQQAIQAGAATEVTTEVRDAVDSADLVCIATPVTFIAEQVIEAAKYCADDAIITDVGSTKAAIVDRVEQDPLASRKFVGSHPIAGGEKTGPQYAVADLFKNRLVVITPTKTTDLSRLEKILGFWKALGARVSQTAPREHDDILAATSHLPHLVAAALASIIPEEAINFAGPGWRDTTRVAGGCPEMWSAICEENRSAIVHQLSNMITCLDEFRSAVSDSDHDSIRQLLTKARENRDLVHGLEDGNKT